MTKDNNSKERPSDHSIAIAIAKKDYSASFTLLDFYSLEVGGDFTKISAFQDPDVIKNINEDEMIFNQVCSFFPRLREPREIDSDFFLDLPDKSAGYSSAALFDPIEALDGNGWQVSVEPNARKKKKTVIVDQSFFDDDYQDPNVTDVAKINSLKLAHQRQIKQIRRLIAEGFVVMVRDERKFVELKYDFGEKIFEPIFDPNKKTDGYFSKNLKKYREELAQDFSLSQDETLVLDEGCRDKFRTLFCSPLNIRDQDLQKGGPISKKCIYNGWFSQIEKLPQEDIFYLVRTVPDLSPHDEKVKKYLDEMQSLYAANGDKTYINALLFCVVVGGKNIEMAKDLFRRGADSGFEINDGFGLTLPMVILAQKGETAQMMEVFLQKGAEIEDCRDDETTPLLSAVFSGNIENVKVLLDNGADIHARDKDGCSVLGNAFALSNYHEMIELLLSRGADIKSDDSLSVDRSLLGTSAFYGDMEKVEFFLEKGADPTKKSFGLTPLEIAIAEEHLDVAKLLSEKTGVSMEEALKKNKAITSSSYGRLGVAVGRVGFGYFTNQNNSAEACFDMKMVGDLISKKVKLLYKERARVDVYDVVNGSFVKLKRDKKKRKIFDGEKIKELQGGYDENLNSYIESTDKAYFKLQRAVKRNKSTQLLGVNYAADIVGIKLNNGAEITELSQDEFGFYNIKTDKECLIHYILEADIEKIKENTVDQGILKIIERYKPNSEPENNTFRNRGVFESRNSYLREAFEAGSGSCVLRSVAALSKIKQDLSSQPQIARKCRAVDIDRKHVALEVATGDGPNDFVYCELGGLPARSRDVGDLGGYKTSLFSRAQKACFDFVRWGGGRAATLISDSSVALYSAARSAIANFRKRTARVADSGAGAVAAKTHADNSLSSEPQLSNSQNTAPKSILEKFENFIASSKSEELEQLAPEALPQLFLRSKQPSLLVAQKNRSGACANYVIEAARKANPQRPIFYIDSLKQIDIFRKAVKIDDALDGKNQKEISAQISPNGFLFDFLKKAQSGKEQDAPLLVINWSGFSAQERTKLNSALDDQNPSIGNVEIPKVKVVSICESLVDDESFVTRHAEKYKTEFAKEAEISTANTETEALEVDLRGATNWRQQLFGRVHLQNNEIVWTKSDFVRALENQEVSSFVVGNCSKVEEFEKELARAQSLGYFSYNGYKIYLPENIEFFEAAENFDFSKFNSAKVEIIKDKTIDEAGVECEIVNAQLFDLVLCQKNLSAQGVYSEKPGFIELAARRPSKTLSLFISSNLSKAQYYSLLSEANKFGVKLELTLAKGVAILSDLFHFVATNPVQPFETKTVQAKIVEASKPRQFKVDADLFVEVEDCSFQDLVVNISHRVSGKTFAFEEAKSDFIKFLQQGNKICLRGEFSESLLQMLQPILLEDYAKNLTLVVENKGDKSLPMLQFLGAKSCRKATDQDLVKSEVLSLNPESHKTFYTDFQNASDLDLMLDAQLFVKNRKKIFEESLKTSPLLALSGDAGVGKTSLVHEYKHHNGFENFDEWVKEGGILFLDESNIINSHLTMFEPLRNGGNKKVFYKGKFYPLDERHKVVFAHNPATKEYGGGREEQKLFLEGAVSVFEMQKLPASYIYYLLKTEIFDKTKFKNDKSEKDDFLAFCKKEIVEYQDCLDLQDQQITIRELQERALGFLAKKIDSNNEKYPYVKNIKNKDFVSTSATKVIENALGRCFAIRDKQVKGQLPAGGQNGVLLEGMSGIGKSALIKAYLEENHLQYYKIDSSTPLEEQKKKIVEAVEGGKALWIDEIDACIDSGIESFLNIALSGHHPTKSNTQEGAQVKAGFMLIASSNGATEAGRKILGKAFRSRLNCVRPSDLEEYKSKDIEKIMDVWVTEGAAGSRLDDESQKKVKEVAQKYVELQKSNKAVNFRVLRRFVEREKGAEFRAIDLVDRPLRRGVRRLMVEERSGGHPKSVA